MADNDSENTNNTGSNESYSQTDIEQFRAEAIDSKIETLLTLSPNTRSIQYEDEKERINLDDELTITPPADYSVLRSYGYSRVELSRSRMYDKSGVVLYPGTAVVESFDEEGVQRECFFIFQLEGNEMHISVPSEEAGTRPVGIDSETYRPTEDITKFDSESHDMMLPFKLRHLQGNEYVSLMSIIVACETDIR